MPQECLKLFQIQRVQYPDDFKLREKYYEQQSWMKFKQAHKQ